MSTLETKIKINKSDIFNLPYQHLNENGLLTLIDNRSISYCFNLIFLDKILKLWNSKIITIETFNQSKYEDDICLKIKTNLDFNKFEYFKNEPNLSLLTPDGLRKTNNYVGHYFENKLTEINLSVNKTDLEKVSDMILNNKGYLQFEIYEKFKSIQIELITKCLKCFDKKYKITDISEIAYLEGIYETRFIDTNLPICIYGKPLDYISQKVIDEYNQTKDLQRYFEVVNFFESRKPLNILLNENDSDSTEIMIRGLEESNK